MTGRQSSGLMLALTLVSAALLGTQPASAQKLERYSAPVLAPWFTSDGFLNKPGVDKATWTRDMTVCVAEAQRVKNVRGAPVADYNDVAYTSGGRYDATASAVASTISAMQDAAYTGNLAGKEFRDCMTSFGYRRYVYSDREAASATADQGFAELVSAETPAHAKLYKGAVFDNYYLAELAPRPYVNGTAGASAPGQDVQPAAEAVKTLPKAGSDEKDRFYVHGDLLPVAPGSLAAPQDGMAIVVVSAHQTAYTAGDTVMRFNFQRVPASGLLADFPRTDAHFSALSFAHGWSIKDETLKGDITQPRYSTFVIPAGRYVLRAADSIDACLGTVTFEVRAGDVAYLGDWVIRGAGLPLAPLINPFGNVRSDIDKDRKTSLRVAVGDDIDGARKAILADDAAKAALRPVAWQNGYRMACDGNFIGRINNAAWSDFDPRQVGRFNDDMAAQIDAAPPTTAKAP